jgi:hypothetical protein
MLYANIGGKKAFWVPLEHLWIESNQILRHNGHLTKDLKKHTGQIHPRIYMQNVTDTMLKKMKEVWLTLQG